MNTAGRQEFVALAEARSRGGLAFRLPFEPDQAWGEKGRHDVTGTIDGLPVRGRLMSRDGAHYLDLGPAWCRGAIAPGTQVSISLGPEGPQVGSMPADLAAALEAEPDARRFFESLATFYRKNFVRWVEQARRPATRAQRIAETVAALKAGKREP